MATIQQTNFTAGELSPRLYGRNDIAKFANGVKLCRNAVPVIHGGARRRPGTMFIGETKDSSVTSILVPFVFNRDQAYLLEFGNNYMRVFKDDGAVLTGAITYEITTPYTTAMLSELDFAQAADTMFLAHPSLPIYRLQRFDNDDWRLMAAPFTVTPFDEIGFKPAAGLTLSTTTVGSGRTATADSSVFLAADVGREIWAGHGIATITAVTSGTVATVTITAAFASTAAASGAWFIKGSPQAPCTPSDKDPVGKSINLTLGAVTTIEAAKTITGLAYDGSPDYRVRVTIAGHGYSTGNTERISGCDPAGYNGTFTITVIDANTFSYSMLTNPGAALTLGQGERIITGSSGGWRNDDVGSFVRINGGLVKVASITSASVAKGTIVEAMTSAIQAETGSWTVEPSVWNADDGYPRTVTISGQRLYASGSPNYPQTVWASEIGDVLNFTLWTADDDAFAFTVDSNQLNPIAYLVDNRNLLALTYGGEFTLVGGVDKPITPTNIQITRQSTWGCAQVRPITVGNEMLFVQRDGRKMRALSYQVVSESFQSPDISALAEHLTAGGLVQIAYQQSPDSIIWAVRADGVLISITYDRDQDVIAWAQHITEGTVEAVTVLPGATEDYVYLVVNRTVGGTTKRYIERLNEDRNTDCSIYGTSESPATTWNGLDHLEGMTVDILADGIVMPQQTVTSGTITLPRAASVIEAGLHYESRIELLTPELMTPTGSAQGKAMRTSKINVRLLDSIGCTINSEQIPFRQFGVGVLDQSVKPFTGIKTISSLGWERGESAVVIEQKQPLPFHVLSVIREFTANG
jgi:hypothetical protein